MYTVSETPLFERLVVAVWTDGERNEFIGWLSSNPLAGNVISAAGGLRKVRWSRAGMGKRGGARVIYFNRLEPVGLGASKAKIGPSEDSFCRICRPIAPLWVKKTVENGPLRSICSRRFPGPTGS